MDFYVELAWKEFRLKIVDDGPLFQTEGFK